MDDSEYFLDGPWPADDAPYQAYAASGGARTSGRHRAADYPGGEYPGAAWQRQADMSWPPYGAPVAEQAPPAQSYSSWPHLAPGISAWPPAPDRIQQTAQRTWDGTVRDDPAHLWEDPRPQRPRDGRPRDTGPLNPGPRDSGPHEWPADGFPGRPPAPNGRTSTSLLAGYAPGTGPLRQVPQSRIAPSGPNALRIPSEERAVPDRTEPPSRAPLAATYGKPLPDWLPFSHRIVLLPKGTEGGQTREHRDVNGGWLRPAVFGAMDGLVTNSSLIAGIGGGGGGHGMIVLTGIAGLIAGAFSMATGEYISVKSQNELTQAEVELERRQHAQDRSGKLDRLTQIFIGKGVSPNLAEAVSRQISADPDRAVETHVREELGIDPDDLPSPRTAAVASLTSFTVGALIPLSPFLIGLPSLPAALVLSGLFAFSGGAAVAQLTGRPAVSGGLRQFAAAFVATAMAFLIGHLVGGYVG